MIKVFISHSSRDHRTAEELVELLRTALSLRGTDIRCSSVDGYRLAGGADTDEEIRRELLAAPVLIGLLSTASIESCYVMFELGGRWGVAKPLIPLLAPGADASLLKGPMAGMNALHCDSAASLHQLVGEVARVLHIEAENPEVYQNEIDDLLALGHLEDHQKHLKGEKPRLRMLRAWLVLGFVLLLGGGYLALRFKGLPSSAAVVESRPFELLAVTVLVRQTDGIFDGREERHLYIRTQYAIRGLKGLSATADGMTKRYTKSEAREVRRWRGNVEQAIKSIGPTNLETIARFGLAPGEIKTVVFGAEVIIDLPFSESDKRRAIRDLVKLGSNEAWWGYPNHDGMTIPVVTIIIESDTNDLEVTEDRSAFRVTKEGNMSVEGVSLGARTARAGSESLWASWRDVKPEELVAFRYAWGPRKQSPNPGPGLVAAPEPRAGCQPIRLVATDFDTALSSQHIGPRPEAGMEGLIGNLQPSGAGPDSVVFTFAGPESSACTYSMTVGYATEVPRPMRVTLNEVGPSVDRALAQETGGYGTIKAASVGGSWKLKAGENHLTFSTYGQGAMPHLSYVTFSPVD